MKTMRQAIHRGEYVTDSVTSTATPEWVAELRKRDVTRHWELFEQNLMLLRLYEAGEATQQQLAEVIGQSQAQVSRAISEMRKQVASWIPGRLAGSAEDLVNRYLSGGITQNQLVEQLKTWPYEEKSHPTSIIDDGEPHPNSPQAIEFAVLMDAITEDQADEIYGVAQLAG